MRSEAAIKDAAFYEAAERRIEYVTIGIGLAAAICAGAMWGVRAGLGVAAGATIAWLNYRWMKQGVGALAKLAVPQHGAEKVHVPKSVYFKFMGRYVLLIGAAYVILKHLNWPVASVLAGFSAVVAAVLLEVIIQLFRN